MTNQGAPFFMHPYRMGAGFLCVDSNPMGTRINVDGAAEWSMHL